MHDVWLVVVQGLGQVWTQGCYYIITEKPQLQYNASTVIRA